MHFSSINHDESLYEKANSFVPERWITKDRQLQTFDQFTFPTFQGGPRICVGRELALYETKLLVVEVIRKYRCELADEKHRKVISDPEWRNDVTMLGDRPSYAQNLNTTFVDDLNLRFYKR